MPPDSFAQRATASAGDLAACAAAIRAGSKTFHAASLLLPRRVREPALALYAFCREADDAIDGSAQPREALARLHTRLDRCYRGEPDPSPVDRAFSAVVHHHAIPREVPAALLEGFAWDAEGREYPDLASLQAYAVRVAGTVGVMMSLLMGTRSPRALARAAELGVAMQLSNVARDVGEDARLGRVYLPAAWLQEVGVEPGAVLERRGFDPRVGAVVARLVEHAEGLYVRAASGIAELPANCRPAIHAARLMYAEIGREVARHAGDSMTRRAVVSSRRKALLLARAMSDAAVGGVAGEWPVLPEARFLVDAVEGHDARFGRTGAATSPDDVPAGDLVWLIGLFERLGERDRAEQAALR